MELNIAYWITIAHLPKWNNLKINTLIKNIYHDQGTTLEDFFLLDSSQWRKVYNLDEKDIFTLNQAKDQIANNSFLAESLINQGFEIIPLNHPDYSPTLKENLKLTYSPPILYVKGNKQLLKEDSIAIVGSRNASEKGLKFTDNIAKVSSDNYKVVVSGFAKGIDKAALDNALKYHGHSIIVLPQGVLTFGTGYKTYYKHIIEGNILVLSAFHPKAPWKVELAMARNPIIYGLAKQIYVADSSDSGGTWSGVRDGLRKGRMIFVRNPETGESNANSKLISLGAIPVDSKGNSLLNELEDTNPGKPVNESESFDQMIISLIIEKALTAKEICDRVKCDWGSRKMAVYLKNLKLVDIVKTGSTNKYLSKESQNQQRVIALDD